MMNRLGPISLRNLHNCIIPSPGPVATIISQKLHEKFQPSHMEIECESQFHNVPKGAEKHFHVTIVSDEFDKLTPIQRHRLVHDCLGAELEGEVHALRITARTNLQWQQNQTTEKPPPCLNKNNA